MNAMVNISLDDLQAKIAKIAELETEAAHLRRQIIDAKLSDPTDRVTKVTAFARSCLTLARFAIANCPPEVIKGWPYDVLRQVANGMGALPDYDARDHELGIDMLSFARDCEKHEIRRRSGVVTESIDPERTTIGEP